MKIFIRIICLILLCSVPCFSAAADRLLAGKEAKELMSRLKQNQEKAATIIGSFTEERSISTMATPLVFSGKIYARPPDFLFMAYEEPFGHIMKFTGKTVLFYVDGAPTADLVNLEAMGNSSVPPMFTWSPADFTGKIIETADSYILDNSKVKADSRDIKITLDKNSLMVKEINLHNSGGDATRIIMTDLQVNKKIPAEILHFSLPPDVIINNLGQ